MWLDHLPASVAFCNVETTGLGNHDRIVSFGGIGMISRWLAPALRQYDMCTSAASCRRSDHGLRARAKRHRALRRRNINDSGLRSSVSGIRRACAREV